MKMMMMMSKAALAGFLVYKAFNPPVYNSVFKKNF